MKDRKKVLFLDRDGVIVNEDQVDSYEKIIWVPHVFEALRKIERETDFSLVMVSNQDGVGTPSFPLEDYEKTSKRILETLEGEDIVFDDINVDFSLPEDNCPGRKPGVKMLEEYINDTSYDLSSSYMVGDRLTDMMLAKNLNAKGIWLTDISDEIPEEFKDIVVLKTSSWLEIASYLTGDKSIEHRVAEVERCTKETEIKVKLDLDGSGKGRVSTGIGFFDHMLEQVIIHGRLDGEIIAKGDLEIDEHHTIEDTALTLGEVIKKALGDKRGIERYGFFILMMDDTVATVSIDFSSRPELIWNVDFPRQYVGDMPTELFKHFFKSFCNSAGANLYVECKNGDTHHMAEAIFKAFGKSIRRAVKRIPNDNSLPSSKGML